jgi:hypothetical protein
MADPVDIINETLHIDGVITTRGDELKAWVYDPYDSGRFKAYLNADDCRALASAFEALAARLDVG